jgi:hypothetical protein
MLLILAVNLVVRDIEVFLILSHAFTFTTHPLHLPLSIHLFLSILGVYLNAGREHAVASTKAFTTQVTVMTLIALWFR